MTVKAYTPKVKVTMFKNVRRDEAGVSKRYRGAGSTVDLTPHMGEHGGVTTSKSIYAPMGQWQLTLADQRDSQTQDTLYALAEPMDSIEIRMAREPHKYAGEMPIVMRGFVSRVRRTETMGPDGRPQRQVVIEGGDYGLAFARVRLTWLQAAGSGAALASLAHLQAVGLSFQAWPAGDFVRDVVGFVVNPWLNEFFERSVSNPTGQSVAPVSRSLGVDVSVTEGTVNPYGIEPFDRPIWDWLVTHCDLAWNELFVEDRDAGPVVVYRPMPFKDINGDWIKQGKSKVGTDMIDVKDDAVVSLDVSRSDANIANLYWANPDAVALVSSGKLKAAAFSEGALEDHSPNSAAELYGSRLMTVPMAQGPTGLGRASSLPKAEQEAYAVAYGDWATARREALKAFNRDNVALEDVSMTLRGDERVKPGRYIRLARGDLKSSFYVHAVTHEFRPFHGFTTSVQGIRGTGLIERARTQSSPYNPESKAGAYDGAGRG